MVHRLVRLLLLILAASPLPAADVHLIRDVNPESAPRGSDPVGFAPCGDRTCFFAFTEVDGYELWSSDGTVEGTNLLADLEVGTEPGYAPTLVASARGFLLFVDVLGDLWRTDGTPEGTFAFPMGRSGVAVGEKYVFFAQTDSGAPALWGTDGTVAGTGILADLPFTGSALASSGETAWFAAGETLWVTDGSASGTRQVASPGFINSIVPREGGAWFGTSQGLWKTDGTEAGTRSVDQTSSPAFPFATLGPLVLFNVDSALWASDGSAGGARLVHSDLSPTRFEKVDESGVLLLVDGALWRTDGTVEGTSLLLTRPYGFGFGFEASGSLNGKVYFDWQDEAHGSELWVSDGTAEGTGMVRDFQPGRDHSRPRGITASHGRLWFSLSTPGGWELGISEGDDVRAIDIEPDVRSSLPRLAEPLAGGKALFFAFDEVHGLEPWLTDGSSDGTSLVTDLRAGPKSSRFSLDSTSAAGLGFFVADDGIHGRELWRSDGTAAGTLMLHDFPNSESYYPSSLTGLGDRMVFIAPTSPVRTAWGSDGTPGGTVRLTTADDQAGAAGFVAIGERALFAIGTALWITDGTPDGTSFVRTLPGSFALHPGSPAMAFMHLFTATGSEVWVTDGTATGTRRIADGWPLKGAGAGDLLVFATDDGRLWRTDGTLEGTTVLRSFDSINTIRRSSFASAGGLAYFFADDGIHGLEPWASDGTLEGTRILRDVTPGPRGSIVAYDPLWLIAGEVAFFPASDGIHGLELWRAPGREARLAADIAPGGRGSAPIPLLHLGNEILLQAFRPDVGSELFAIPENPDPPVRRRAVRR